MKRLYAAKGGSLKKNIIIYALIWTIHLIPLCAIARDISGTVLSETDSSPVPGAACQIKSGDKYLAGVTADATGKFTISTDIKTPLSLEVSMTGFHPTDIYIAGGSKDINIGTVYLSEGEELKEVVVVGSHAMDSRGRTIVYPSTSEVKSSTNTVSLFQKLPLPGLDANPITRSLSVDGGSPMILINGVPASITDLNAISPKDIAKVEFSRQTPARYADRGASGLISVTLKVRRDGGNVFLYGRSAFNCGFMDYSLYSSYHQGPSELTLSYSPTWRNYHNVYDTREEAYIGSDFRTDIKSTDRNPFNYFGGPVSVKYNYAPNTSTLLSTTFSMSHMTNNRRIQGFSEDSYLGDYDWRTRYQGKDLKPSLDIFFHREFDSRNTLEAEVVGTLASSKYRNASDYLLPSAAESYATDIDSRRHSLITEVSYTHTFDRATELSIGFQNTLSHSKNTYLTSDYTPVLTENNNYLYAQLGRQFGKVYVAASTGLKMFWTKNDLNKRHFIRNLTLVQASYNINSRWSMQAAFQYSPTIPSLSQLTDYPQQTSPYLVGNGNPGLKVAEVFAYQVAPTFRCGKFNTSLLLTYRTAHNAQISDIFYLGDDTFLSQTVNAKRMRQFNPSLSMQVSGVYGFGARVNLALAYYHYKGEAWSHDLTSFEASGSIWWTRGAWTVAYYGRIPGKYLSGHYVGKGENGNNLSVSWSPDKRWTIEAGWYNCLDRKGFKYPSESISTVNPQKSERWIEDNGNMIALSLTYTANFGSIFRSAKRSLNNSDSGTALPSY